MSRRTRPLRVCGSCGLSSVSGRPPGRPYEYTLSMFTKRAPLPSAAASSAALQGREVLGPAVVDGVQRLVDGCRVLRRSGRERGIRDVTCRHVDIAERVRIAAERRSTARVDNAHGEAAARRRRWRGRRDRSRRRRARRRSLGAVGRGARRDVGPEGSTGRYRGEHLCNGVDHREPCRLSRNSVHCSVM